MTSSTFQNYAFVSFILFTSIVLLTERADAQPNPPLPEKYPVRQTDIYKGKPVRPLLDSKRARLYRTVLRQGAMEGPNFAGRYTIVTWGAGLGVFSMAVVDARNGKVYFPPFTTVGNTAYGMPYLDKGENPAWKVDSKLFAFIGRPDANDKGMGMYVYSFDRGRFRFLYFEKEDEEKRKADQAAWEKELDKREASMAETFQIFRKRMGEIYPEIRCAQSRGSRYPWPVLDGWCTKDDLIVGFGIEYHSTPDEAIDIFRSELQFSSLPKWRSIEGLGEQGIETDQCSRAWVRFRKGTFFVRMNANLNQDAKDDPKCSNEQDANSKRLVDLARKVAFVMAGKL